MDDITTTTTAPPNDHVPHRLQAHPSSRGASACGAFTLGVGASAAEDERVEGRGKGERGVRDVAEGGELIKGKQREREVVKETKDLTKDTRKWITVGHNGKPIPEEEEVLCVCVPVCLRVFVSVCGWVRGTHTHTPTRARARARAHTHTHMQDGEMRAAFALRGKDGRVLPGFYPKGMSESGSGSVFVCVFVVVCVFDFVS